MSDKLSTIKSPEKANGLARLFAIKSQKGVTLIEYSLIAALVGVAAIAGLTALGGDINTIFNGIGTKIASIKIN